MGRKHEIELGHHQAGLILGKIAATGHVRPEKENPRVARTNHLATRGNSYDIHSAPLGAFVNAFAVSVLIFSLA
jgi:hypothetical protein